MTNVIEANAADAIAPAAVQPSCRHPVVSPSVPRGDARHGDGSGSRSVNPPSSVRRLALPRRLRYVLQVLTPDELAMVPDAEDALIIARIKRMSARRLTRFDRFVPTGSQHCREYYCLQLQWVRSAEYLLGTRLGRPPTQRELVADFTRHANGPRFRAYFAMKFPLKVSKARA